jgi:hypothetical protein
MTSQVTRKSTIARSTPAIPASTRSSHALPLSAPYGQLQEADANQPVAVSGRRLGEFRRPAGRSSVFNNPFVPGMLRSLLRPNCVHQTPVTRYRQMSPTLMKYALTRYLSQVVAMPNDID